MVHPDFKSHNILIMTTRKGEIQSVSREQKPKVRISTETKLVYIHDISVYITWKVLFIEWEGYNID